MKETEGVTIGVYAGVIKPEREYLNQGQKHGDATIIVDNADKEISKGDMPTIDVKVGTHECGKKGNEYYRVADGKYVKISEVENRIAQRGINQQQIQTETER